MRDNHNIRPVVGLGQASLDFLGRAPYFPEADTKCELSGLTVQGGGPVATALVTLSRLGRPTRMIGAVGDDLFGRLIREGLAAEGVDVSGLLTASGASSQTAFIAVEPSGARTIFWLRGPSFDIPGPGVLDQAAALHLDGLPPGPAMKAAREARVRGIPVFFDAGALRETSIQLCALTDYLICSERFFRDFHQGPDLGEGLQRLHALGPRQVVATFGAEGSRGYDGVREHFQPAYPVRAVDTTGAGDVYHGAYIHGVLSGWDLAGCMRFASAAAALKCEKPGGRTGIPDSARLREFMGADFPGD
ncbi:MAG: PfkB family carbohydrate kinase [Thermodesulfobacteriota bacterium]